MGLSMSVGYLAFLNREEPDDCFGLRRQLTEVNRVLRANGLPPHEEPESLPELEFRYRHVGLPYTMLHYLRRAVAHAMSHRNMLEPVEPGVDPSEDHLYDKILCSSESHLICHSDCEGYYVPVDFPEPLYDDLPDGDRHCIHGGILGSSQGVLRELLLTAPLLDIPVLQGALNDREFARIHDEPQDATPFWIERQVWLKFFELARLSIQFKTAIVFG
jgi:hypothetical protein